MKRKLQYSSRHLMFATAFVAVAIWSITTTVARTRQNIEAVQSTYAARLVTQMCVAHMKANGDAWPKDWEDIRDDFAPCLARSGQTWTFAELNDRVGVDWHFNPKDSQFGLESSSVVWIASNPTQEFYGTHPNEIVSQYLASTRVK
ncbi:hypothetical protein SH528x_002931 [Novipirellula sp. SH528]|uniref:hypothetical protein n=1 Tax=Novipirellula sp. SH528 TaxID=3454466 RepID=UPI003F9F2061